MSILTQIEMFFKVKASALFNRLEDPRETLEFTYQRQQEMLQQVKKGLIEVATSRHQIEGQARKLRERLPLLDDQAKRALAARREDLARAALQRKQVCLSELARLDQQATEVAAEERKLTIAQEQFAQRVDAFRTRRESLSARYTAAEAQVRINETLSGVSSEAASLGQALERAEGQIDHMQARASAINALIDSGALASVDGSDAVERELHDLAAAQAVEAELAHLKQAQSQPPASETTGG